jgi:hypothetical protein
MRHLLGLLRWLGYPPGIQAIPVLSLLGYLLARLLDRRVGFNETTNLGDWLNLLSAAVVAVPAFAVLDNVYGIESARAAANRLQTVPGLKALAKAFSDSADRQKAKAGGISVTAVLGAYLGFVLLIASTTGSLWFETSAPASPDAQQEGAETMAPKGP